MSRCHRVLQLQGVGVAGLALIALYLTNRYHLGEKRAADERHRDEVAVIRKDYGAVIDQKDSVIDGLSTRLQGASEQSRADSQRNTDRQVEEVQRLESTIHTCTTATLGLQDAVKELCVEVRARP